MVEKAVRKQTAISLKMKMELLKAVDEKRRSKTEICKEFGIANSTLSTIIKKRDQITTTFEHSIFEPERKRMRTAKHEELEIALLVWFQQARSQNARISGPLLLEKADELAKQMGIEFSANPGWLERFKKRNGIVLQNVSCEANKVLPTMTTNWLQSMLPSILQAYAAKDADELTKLKNIDFSENAGWLEHFKKRNSIVIENVPCEDSQVSPTKTTNWLESMLPSILKEYAAKDIFNADETGLFYRCLPNKVLSFKEQSCSGRKISKERITVWVGCNSDGSEKLPLFVKGESLKLQCLKNVRTLPVQYTAVKEELMASTIFTDWILNLDKRFLQEKRKVAIIIDNCLAYPDVKLKAIKLIHLPPNTTSVLQPYYQGIIQNLKFYYRKQLLRKYLLAMEAKENFSINLLDALHILHYAWHLVTQKTIENCFRLAGFSKDSLAPQELADIETEPTFNEIFSKVSTLLDCPTVSSEEFITFDDDNACTAAIEINKDILEIVQSSKDPVDVDSNDESNNEISIAVPVPNTSEMRNIMKSMRSYLDAHSNGEMNNTMGDIEQFIENFMVKKVMQQTT